MRRIYETIIIFAAAVCWWGFIYPELSMVTEACAQEAEADEQKTEDGAQEAEASKRMADISSEIGKKLGITGLRSGNFCIKSRIAEYLYQ